MFTGILTGFRLDVDLVYLIWNEVSLHPDAPMDWQYLELKFRPYTSKKDRSVACFLYLYKFEKP
jgi:hypothetical protein